MIVNQGRWEEKGAEPPRPPPPPLQEPVVEGEGTKGTNGNIAGYRGRGKGKGNMKGGKKGGKTFSGGDEMGKRKGTIDR